MKTYFVIYERYVQVIFGYYWKSKSKGFETRYEAHEFFQTLRSRRDYRNVFLTRVVDNFN
jgi:hypothetical protein